MLGVIRIIVWLTSQAGYCPGLDEVERAAHVAKPAPRLLGSPALRRINRRRLHARALSPRASVSREVASRGLGLSTPVCGTAGVMMRRGGSLSCIARALGLALVGSASRECLSLEATFAEVFEGGSWCSGLGYPSESRASGVYERRKAL